MNKCYWCEEYTKHPVKISGSVYCQSCFDGIDCGRCGEVFDETDDSDFICMGHYHLHKECAELEAKDRYDERMADEMRESMLMERDGW